LDKESPHPLRDMTRSHIFFYVYHEQVRVCDYYADGMLLPPMHGRPTPPGRISQKSTPQSLFRGIFCSGLTFENFYRCTHAISPRVESSHKPALLSYDIHYSYTILCVCVCPYPIFLRYPIFLFSKSLEIPTMYMCEWILYPKYNTLQQLTTTCPIFLRYTLLIHNTRSD